MIKAKFEKTKKLVKFIKKLKTHIKLTAKARFPNNNRQKYSKRDNYSTKKSLNL